MIRVTVAQSTVREMKGTSQKTGRPYEMRFQTAYAHTVDKDGNPPPFPEKIEISLDRDQPAYGRGEYTLHPSSLYVDRDGRLACGIRLTPLPAAKA